MKHVYLMINHICCRNESLKQNVNICLPVKLSVAMQQWKSTGLTSKQFFTRHGSSLRPITFWKACMNRKFKYMESKTYSASITQLYALPGKLNLHQ